MTVHELAAQTALIALRFRPGYTDLKTFERDNICHVLAEAEEGWWLAAVHACDWTCPLAVLVRLMAVDSRVIGIDSIRPWAEDPAPDVSDVTYDAMCP